MITDMHLLVSCYGKEEDLIKMFTEISCETACICFEKILPVPKELKDLGEDFDNKDKQLIKNLETKYGAKDYIHWVLRNWGSSQPEDMPTTEYLHEQAPCKCCRRIGFDTINGDPIKIFFHLSENYKNIKFVYRFHNLDCDAGIIKISNGKINQNKSLYLGDEEYDIEAATDMVDLANIASTKAFIKKAD